MDSTTVHLTHRTERLQAEAANRRLGACAMSDARAGRRRRDRLPMAAGLALVLAAAIAGTVLAIPGSPPNAAGGLGGGHGSLHR